MDSNTRKSKAAAPGVITQLREKIVIILASVLIVLALGGGFVTCYQRHTLTGEYRHNYEGQVIEKYVTNHESQQGTFVTRHILVKSNAGEQFPVVVSADIFERAQIGMWIKREETGILLSADGRIWK